jgi:hypothetical protein
MREIEMPFLIIVVLLVVVAFTLLLIFLDQEKTEFVSPIFVGKIKLPGAVSCDLVAYNSEFDLLFAADAVNGKIHVFSREGKKLSEFKRREYGKTGFLALRDLLAYENGVLVSDPLERQVFFLKVNGRPVEVLAAKLPVSFKPGLMAAGPEQSFFVVDDGSGCVLRVSPQGTILEKRNLLLSYATSISGAYFDGTLLLASGKMSGLLLNKGNSFKTIRLQGRSGSYYPFDLLKRGAIIYIVDPFYQEVIAFNVSGREIGSYGRSIVVGRQLDLPVNIDAGDGLIFVAEKKERCVSIWKLQP